MKKIVFLIVVLYLLFGALDSSFADRDWEHWTQGNISIPINKLVRFVVIPEWRFKNDMNNMYQFKLETGTSFKINEHIDITPYYVYQDKKVGNIWDRSDLMYMDGTLKLPLKSLFDIKLSNRLRYQYDFDKVKTTIRNLLKISKGFKVGKQEIAPYVSEEPFYDCKSNRVVEHRSTVGLSYSFSKDISVALGYMLNSKRGKSKWTYANVLVSNLNIKF